MEQRDSLMALRRFFGVIFAVVTAVEVTAGSVAYCDWNGTEVVAATNSDYRVFDGSELVLGTGWWIVTNKVTIKNSQYISINGKVKLILCDEASLTVTNVAANCAAIDMSVRNGINNSLTIYGQEGGTGKLIASGGECGAGIGGSRQCSGGEVTVNGGDVTATGGRAGAGIGGGGRGACGKVKLNCECVKIDAGGLGNDYQYVKISERASGGPMCNGGELFESVGGYIIVPTNGATSVIVVHWPRAATIKEVEFNDCAVSAAVFIGFKGQSDGVFSLSLDPEALVGGVPVRPVLGETEDEKLVLNSDQVLIGVRTIANLRYALRRAENAAVFCLKGMEQFPESRLVTCESVLGDGKVKTLKDEEPLVGQSFYQIVVTTP